FATTPEEAEQAERLKQKLAEALTQGSDIPALWPTVVAAHFPLHSLPNAQTLLEGAWPAALTDVLAHEAAESWDERQYRDLIPRLTGIDEDVSVLVRGQYEESPYPRWVRAASASASITLVEHVRTQFPTAAFRTLGSNSGIEVLVAGCGAG